jgi:hypothetical protein
VPLGAKPCAVPPLIWLEPISSLLAPIRLEILIMTDFGRQARLNGRPFEPLAQAIARKDPKHAQAIISFEPDAVTGEAAPSDLFHDEIEKLRASAGAYLARARQKPEINEREAAEFIKGMGRVATIVVHDNGLVTASAIFANMNAAERFALSSVPSPHGCPRVVRNARYASC